MKKKTKNGNGKKSYGVKSDDIMDFLEHHMVTKEEFNEQIAKMVTKEEFKHLKNEVTGLKDEVLGLSNLIRRHLEISDDRYFEVRKKHELYEYWIKKIAGKLKMKLEIPSDLVKAFS